MLGLSVRRDGSWTVTKQTRHTQQRMEEWGKTTAQDANWGKWLAGWLAWKRGVRRECRSVVGLEGELS